MMERTAKRVSYDIGCMKSLKKLPDKVAVKFMEMMTRYMTDPSGKGLNLETVEGAKDSAIKSLRWTKVTGQSHLNSDRTSCSCTSMNMTRRTAGLRAEG